MTFRAIYLSCQHLRGTEHCLTCPSLRKSMKHGVPLRKPFNKTIYISNYSWPGKMLDFLGQGQFQQLDIRWREVIWNRCYCIRKEASRGCWICNKERRKWKIYEKKESSTTKERRDVGMDKREDRCCRRKGVYQPCLFTALFSRKRKQQLYLVGF